MNATFGEVLQEVLMSLLIMEPNMKRSRIRGRCLETKRVLRRSSFALGCHAQTIRERERERERERGRQVEKHHHNRVPNDRKERVHMHEYVICKKIASWVQPNLNLSAHKFSTYKHTSKCMKHCENANGMQCMII